MCERKIEKERERQREGEREGEREGDKQRERKRASEKKTRERERDGGRVCVREKECVCEQQTSTQGFATRDENRILAKKSLALKHMSHTQQNTYL